jgi:hypothetical protein
LYRIDVYPEAGDQLAALPTAALAAYSELHAALELTPWNGAPQNKKNPGGPVRNWVFGPDAGGLVVYLILEDQREVHVIRIVWVG